MNKALSKIGEGLIIGVMVAIVGSLTGILWKEYHGATDELNNARELLEKQIIGQNEVQAKINDNIKEYIASSQKFKNETILKFIEQQNETNQNISQALDGLKEMVMLAYSKSQDSSSSPTSAIEVPDFTGVQETPIGMGSVPLTETGMVSLPEYKPLSLPEIKPLQLPTMTELEKDNKRLEQLETYQMEQGVLQKEQIQIQQQIKR